MGDTYSSNFFMSKYLVSKTFRFCIIISNKVSKKAVKRNQLRRRLSESIRINMQQFNLPYNIIILPNKKAIDTDYKTLEQEVIIFLSSVSKL